RGRATRAHAPHETGGPGLDSRLSRCPRVKEAARSAHGLWQGGSRAVGDPRQAGPNLVRGRWRVGSDAAPGAWTGRSQVAAYNAIQRADRRIGSRVNDETF